MDNKYRPVDERRRMMKIFWMLLLIFPLMMPFKSWANFNESQMLIENEKNSIKVFDENVLTVVNVINIQKIRRSFFDLEGIEAPTGAGSGFVWDKIGHIVTNYHVVQEGDNFMISFHKDKKQYKAKLVGAEPTKDIAVLRLLELPEKLTPVRVGTTKGLMVGQKALAIGNPFGLDHTLTVGIISSLDRQMKGIGGVTIRGMIQTDASINPGNSGGPLLDSSGHLIGMNTMIISQSGSSSGVGFAVPVNTIASIVPELIQYGEVVRPALGIALLPDHMKIRFDIKEGIIIASVQKGSPAQEAGLQGLTQDNYGRIYLGDIITQIDNKKVNSYDDILFILESYKVGDTVKVTYVRDSKENWAKVKLVKL